MTLRPLEQWICDSCGQVIRWPDDGWVVWTFTWRDPHVEQREDDYANQRISSMRIVHDKTRSPRTSEPYCYPYSDLPENGLHAGCDFIGRLCGPDGLSRLIAMLTAGAIEDVENWANTVQRLHTPHFEEARMYLNEAFDNGFYESGYVMTDENRQPENYFVQDNLKALIRLFGSHRNRR